MGGRRFRILHDDLAVGLALDCGIENRNARQIILRSMKLQRRTLHLRGKSGEPHFPIGVGSGFEIEPSYSAKSILDMNFDGGSVNRFSVSAPNRQFDGARTCTAFYGRNFFG